MILTGGLGFEFAPTRDVAVVLTLASGRGEELGIGTLHQVLHKLRLPFRICLGTPRAGGGRAVKVMAAAVGAGDAGCRVGLAQLLYMVCKTDTDTDTHTHTHTHTTHTHYTHTHGASLALSLLFALGLGEGAMEVFFFTCILSKIIQTCNRLAMYGSNAHFCRFSIKSLQTEGGGYHSYNYSNAEIEPHEYLSWQL